MSTLLSLPLTASTLQKALAAVQKVLKNFEFPEKARVIIQAGGNPILVYDTQSHQLAAMQAVNIQVPLTGATLTGSSAAPDELIEVQPAGTLAALTINLEATPFLPIGAQKKLSFNQVITALTVAAPGATVLGTAATSAAVGTCVSYQKLTATTWRRLY